MVTISDPLSIPFLLFEGAWIVLGFAFLAAAYRARSEWVKASLGMMGIAILGIRTLMVIPSWWLYYADAELKWGGNGCVTLDLQCLKQSVKDTIVVVENGIMIGAFIVAFWLYQKRFPKQLAPGEAKPEATGGYK